MTGIGDDPHIQPSEIPSSAPSTPPAGTESLKTNLQGHTVTLGLAFSEATTDKASSIPVKGGDPAEVEEKPIHAVELPTTPTTPEETQSKTEYQKLSERFGFQTDQPSPSFVKMIKSISIKQAFRNLVHSFTSAGRAEAKEINDQKKEIKTIAESKVKSYVMGNLGLKSTSTNSYVALLDTIKADVKNGRFTDSEIDSLSEDVIAEILYDLTAGREVPDSHRLNDSRCEKVNGLLIDREALHIAQSIESGTLPEIMNGPYPAFVIPPKTYNKGLITPDEMSQYKAELYDKAIVSALKLFAQTPEGRIKAVDSFVKALKYAVPAQRDNLMAKLKGDPLLKNIEDKLSYVRRVDQHLTKMDESARAHDRSIVEILQKNFGSDRLPEVISYTFNAFVDSSIMDEMIQTCAEIGDGAGSFQDAHTAITQQTEKLFPPGTLSEKDRNTLSKRVADKLIAFAENPKNQGPFSTTIANQTKNTKKIANKIDTNLYETAKDCADQFKTMTEEAKENAIQALLRGVAAAENGNAVQFLVVLRELSDPSTNKILEATLTETMSIGGNELQLLSDYKEVSSFHDSVREKLSEASANYEGEKTITELLREIHTSVNEGRDKKIPEKAFMQSVMIVKGSIKSDPKGVIEKITERDSVARTVAEFRGKRSFGDKWGLKRRKWEYELQTTAQPKVSARRMSQFCALYVENGPKEGREQRLEEVTKFLSNFLPRLSEENRIHFAESLSQIKEISGELHEVAENLLQAELREVSKMTKAEPKERQSADALKDTLTEIANTNGKGRIKNGVLVCKPPKGEATVQKGESAKSAKAMEFALDQIESRFQGDLSDDEKRELESILTPLMASDWAKSVFKNSESLNNRKVALTRKLAESKGTTVKDNETLILNHLATGALRSKLLTIYHWQMTSEQFFTKLAEVKEKAKPEDVKALCVEWLENDAFNSGDVEKAEEQLLSLTDGDEKIKSLIASKKGAARQFLEVPEGSGDLSAQLKEVGQGNRGTLVKDLAADLRFRSAHAFSQIKMDDLANQKWAKEKKWDIVDGKAVPPAGLRGCTDYFNNTASLVVDAILSEGEQVARTRQIEFFIDLAETCFEQGDFQTFMAIVAGLGDSSVHRLKSSFEGIEVDGTQAISKSHKEKLATCKKRAESMVEGVQLANIRKAISAAKEQGKPYIPFPGIYLTDITFGDDKNPDEIEGEINQVKLDVLAGHQGEFISAMSNLGKPKEGELKYHLSSLLKEGSSEENYTKSLELEPRSVDQTRIRAKIDKYKRLGKVGKRLEKMAKQWDAEDLTYLISSNLLEDAQAEKLMKAIGSSDEEKFRAVNPAFRKRKKEGSGSDETRPPSPTERK